MDAKFDFFEIRNSLTLIYLMKNKNLYFTSFLLFLLFLSLRVPGIFSLSVQPDEYHWRERSLEILTQFREHNISNLTTHLGQPGVPPALLMAFGDWAASKIGLIGTTFGEYRFDYLHAARFMCAFVSSLIVFTSFSYLIAYPLYHTLYKHIYHFLEYSRSEGISLP